MDDKKNKKRYSVGIGPARFQLQHMGHYLIREERKDPDPRVQGFIPDTWQVMMQTQVEKIIYMCIDFLMLLCHIIMRNVKCLFSLKNVSFCLTYAI